MNPARPGRYRRGVGIILRNRQGLLFVGQRRDQKAEAWQLPQGGIDEGEKPETAFYRELEEEVGLKPSHIHLVRASRSWLSYDLPPDLQGKLWGGGYVGQKQLWYLADFVGQDQDIRIDAHRPPEFKQWRWARVDEILGIIVPFKQPLYRQILAEFEGELS